MAIRGKFKYGVIIGAFILCSVTTAFIIHSNGEVLIKNQGVVQDGFSQNRFDISFDEYEKVDFSDLNERGMDFESEFIELYFNIPKEVGDQKPVIYFKNEAESIIVIQKSDGTHKIYYLELKENGWFIVLEDLIEGDRIDFEV